jgi:hypothetical protein
MCTFPCVVEKEQWIPVSAKEEHDSSHRKVSAT